MMMAGRGRMQQQQQQQQQQVIKGPGAYLTYFNQYISVKISSYLTKEDRENLGKIYPKYKPKELTPEQKQKMEERRKKMIEAAKNRVCIAEMKEKSNDDTTNTSTPTEDEKDSEQTTAEVTDTEENNDEHEFDDGLHATEEEKGQDDGTTPKQQVKDPAEEAQQEAAVAANLTDCHTLLARLNTRRLYRRMKHLKKQDKNVDTTKIYPFNKTTEQIAIYEWQKLLFDFKKSQMQKLKEQEEAAEKAAREILEAEESEKGTNEEKKTKDNNEEKKNDDKDGKEKDLVEEKKEEESKFVMPSPIPSRCELLLFSPCPRAVAVLASYPRSGNSLMRNLYERTSLRVTGSDMRGGLQKHDLVGEAATQTNCVQFVKTHYPERMGQPPFRVNRAVLLVRNPYDAMESYFNLMTTNTHTSSLSEEERKKHEKIFADMARKEILVWRDFHEYWLQQKIPLLVIRYEDLIRYTDKVIAKVLKFVLEINDMKFFEDRIDRCIREEQIERLGSYKPRSGGVGKSLTKGVYSPELLQEINTGIIGTMEKFGYTEMLVPNPKEWKLEPLDQLGVYIPGTAKEPLVINQKGLVRGPQRNTDWRAVKRQMEMKEQICTCYKCLKGSR
jgi:hypothetical protein